MRTLPLFLAAACHPSEGGDPAVPSAPPDDASAARCEQPVRGPERYVDLDPDDPESMGTLVALDDGDIGWVSWIDTGGPFRLVAGRVSGRDEVPLAGAPRLEFDPDVDAVAFRSDGWMWQVQNVAGSPPKLGRRDSFGNVDLGFGRDGALPFGQTEGSAVDMVLDPTGRPLLVLSHDAEKLLARATDDGDPDPGFNGGEPLLLDGLPEIAQFPDGRILLVYGRQPLSYAVLAEDGAPDAGFPAQTLDLGADRQVRRFLPEADGLLVLSQVYTYGADGNLLDGVAQLHRVLPDGTVAWVADLVVPIRARWFDVLTMQRDGSGYLLVAGQIAEPIDDRWIATSGWAMRLRPDLTTDACFGRSGRGVHTGVWQPVSITDPLPDGSLAIASSVGRTYTVFGPGPAEDDVP